MRLPPYTIKSASLVALVFAAAASAIHTGMIMDVGTPGLSRAPAAAVSAGQSMAPAEAVPPLPAARR